jgi:hypothetical protein
MKTVLNISASEAKEFFLKQYNYCNINLPPYFDFQPLLDELNKAINNRPLKDIKSKNPKDCEDANYKFYSNKDGAYSWRPLQLVNPAIYICLVDAITNAWTEILERFKEFRANNNIVCCSIPIYRKTKRKNILTKKTILNWWEEIEQKSIEYSLEYGCFFNTDVVDCYGSIYTHSIPWALKGKTYSKAHRNEDNVGNTIDALIQAMSYGQTNGIPQGSTLFDFIAEMVLGYADMKLTKRIEEYNNEHVNDKIEHYKILRYRDDYRIFADIQEKAVIIAKLLSEVLQGLNLRMNSKKTFLTTDVVRDAVKPDKLFWNESKQSEESLQKHLLLIHSLAEKYPNSGSVSRALDEFYIKIYKTKKIKESNTKVMISIIVDIMYKNPRIYPIACSILAKLLHFIRKPKDIGIVLNSIVQKLYKVPNVGHLQVWLQRITLKSLHKIQFSEKLCELIEGSPNSLWNIDWLKGDIKKIFASNSPINQKILDKTESLPSPKEIRIFEY